MRIAELSRETGVAVATIKYYLREGLLPAGELTSRNQAQYGAEHIDRLRLIRALIDAGGLPVAAVKDVLAEMDTPGTSPFKAVGAAHRAAASRPAAGAAPPADGVRADALVERLGWHAGRDNPGRPVLAEVLAALDGLGQRERTDALLEHYAAAAEALAEAEVAQVRDAGDVAGMAETAVVWSVLGDTLLRALRLLAQEHVSRAHLPGGHRKGPGGRR